MAGIETIAQVATGGLISTVTAYVVARRTARTSFEIEESRQGHELHRDSLRDEATAANEAAIVRGHARLLQRSLTSTAMSFAVCAVQEQWWPETSPFGSEPLGAELRPLASALSKEEWTSVDNALRLIQTLVAWRTDVRETRELSGDGERLLRVTVGVVHRAIQALDRVAEHHTPDNDYGLSAKDESGLGDETSAPGTGETPSGD